MDSSLYIEIFERQVNELLDCQDITNPNTLMYQSYISATAALKSIISASDAWYNDKELTNVEKFYGYGSNVIAFCGARGHGKTSAMLSFSHALESGTGKAFNPPLDSIPECSRFFVLPPIDPTLLAPHESVINLIITSLFRQMEDNWRDTCENMTPENSQRHTALLKLFQKCRDCLARQASSCKEQELSDFMQSSNILEVRKYLYHIITEYFRMKKAQGKNSYLIIQLDDTDMDMVNAYNVLEDIRKYLALPQTVVLMATYLRQLRILVAKHFEDALRLKEDDPYPVADYMQMAAQYIDKLIPAPQIIHLNSFRYRKDLNGKIKIGDFEDINIQKNKDFEKAFFELIEEKTGLRFMPHRTYVNNILPTTLRGLSHLYKLLRKMESPENIPRHTAFSSPQERQKMIKRYRTSLELYQRNLIVFEDYFRNDWCYNSLDSRDQEILWKISQTHVAPKLRIIMNLLKERFSDTKESNTIEDYSYVDLVNYLLKHEDKAGDMRDFLLIFAVRTHIAIQMHKIYLSEKLAYLRDRSQNDRSNTYEEADNGVLTPLDYSRVAAFVNCDKEMPKEKIPKSLVTIERELSDSVEKAPAVAKNKTKNNSVDNHCGYDTETGLDEKTRLYISNLYYLLFKKYTEAIRGKKQSRASTPDRAIYANGESMGTGFNTERSFSESKEDIADPLLVRNLSIANLQDAAFRILANPDVLRRYLVDELEDIKEYNGVINKNNGPLNDPDLGNLNGVKSFIEEIKKNSLSARTGSGTAKQESKSNEDIDTLSMGGSDII